MSCTIEKARIDDAVQVQKMVNSFAERGEMLARPLSEIYENIRDFFVAREDGEVTACAALHIAWSDLAEVKSLAVSDEHRHQGLGKKLVNACLDEARTLGIASVFCLTYVKPFFERCGFVEEDKGTLPHKIWGECYRCPKFPNCDESALIFRIKQP
jgi:amino-acid N-acetyltransferase